VGGKLSLFGCARVVRADVDHRVRVVRRRVGVRCLDGAVPVATLGGGRVVEARVLDGEVADLLAVDGRLDLLDHRGGLRGIRATEREARVHVDLRRALALLVLARGRAGGISGGSATGP